MSAEAKVPPPDSETPDDSLSPVERFSPEEEAHLLSESHAQKSQANELFTSSAYSEAIGAYDKALSSCPNYLEYEIAVLQSNIAACHIKLEDWKAAVESATKSLNALERELPKAQDKKEAEEDGGDGVVAIGEGDGEMTLEALQAEDKRKANVAKIRCKALMRRARGKMEQGGWGNLAGAEEDYKELSRMENLSPPDRRSVQRELATLPARIGAAKESEMGEMMGKLKELGNGILKPFGLSTDMFQMTKDAATGGYSMSFDQGKK